MRPLRPALVAALVLSLALGPAAPALAAPAAGQVLVKVGTTDGLSRLEFQGAQPISAKREGADLVLRFGRIAAPDLSRLRVDPPPFLKTAQATPVNGGIEVRLTLADGAEARLGKADGATYVNLAAPAPAPAAAGAPSALGPAPQDQMPAARANPVPAGGVVRMHSELQGRTLLLRFPWRAALGAARP